MKRLREIAEAAVYLPQDWYSEDALRDNLFDPEDVAFIHAFDPVLVLKLLDVVEAAAADGDWNSPEIRRALAALDDEVAA